MKFSFFMMPIHDPRENPTLAFQRDIALVHLADKLGFDELYIGEHHSGGWETMPAPEMALAFAAANAHRIRLGTSVLSLPFHHPFHVAERMCFLDHLTFGRAILGVGPCSLVTDKMLFGMDDKVLYPMLHEAIDVIVRLLESDEPISHKGQFWQFENMRLQLRSYQQPRLPIALPSAGTPQNLDLIGRHGMIWLSPAGRMGRGGLKRNEQWALVEQGAKAAGRVADRGNWRIVTNMYLAETREQAWADIRDGLMRETEYMSSIGFEALAAAYPGQRFDDFTPESIVAARNWVVGTPDDAIRWIEGMVEETGGFGGVMLTASEWTSFEKISRSVEMFARYVIPRFARGGASSLGDEWRRTERRWRDGVTGFDAQGRPSNLWRS
jgi:limonene 1,2-monooxygenase